MSGVRAAHPLVTDDTGTQGTGNAEFEGGFSWTRDGRDSAFVFQPQLSYGVLPALDLIAAPSWLVTRTEQDGTARGFGDTSLEAKWRFFASAPLSFAVRGGATFPTGKSDPRLSPGKPAVHAVFAMTVDAAPLTVHGNLGYTRDASLPGLRADIFHVSAAAVFAVNQSLSVAIDAGFDSNADAARRTWPGVLLTALIYKVRPGLDVDIGYQGRLNHAAPRHQLLMGVTYRWGL